MQLNFYPRKKRTFRAAVLILLSVLLFVGALCGIFSKQLYAVYIAAKNRKDARSFYSSTVHYIRESIRFSDWLTITSQTALPGETAAQEGYELLYLHPTEHRLYKAVLYPDDEPNPITGKPVFDKEDYPALGLKWSFSLPQQASDSTTLLLQLTIFEKETGTRVYSGSTPITLDNIKPTAAQVPTDDTPLTLEADGSYLFYHVYYAPQNIDPDQVLPESVFPSDSAAPTEEGQDTMG